MNAVEKNSSIAFEICAEFFSPCWYIFMRTQTSRRKALNILSCVWYTSIRFICLSNDKNSTVCAYFTQHVQMKQSHHFRSIRFEREKNQTFSICVLPHCFYPNTNNYKWLNRIYILHLYPNTNAHNARTHHSICSCMRIYPSIYTLIRISIPF